jgi:hypothetical protein
MPERTRFYMLQVTFRNLLPSEELIGAAHDVYRELYQRWRGRSRPPNCYVTVSARSCPPDPCGWVHVQVEIHHPERSTTRVHAEGANAQLAVRSSMRAAVPSDLEPKSVLKLVSAPSTLGGRSGQLDPPGCGIPKQVSSISTWPEQLVAREPD